MNADQQKAVGVAARRLLELAWSQDPYDEGLVRHGLRCVARTFESDPRASSLLLRRALDRAHLERFGYNEAFTLATESKRLISLDPVFVRDAYAAIFGFDEKSNEATPLSGSQILPITSNRRQDYDIAQHELARIFPEFLITAPQQAMFALVASVRGYTSHRHASQFEKYVGGAFEFFGLQAYLKPDGSCMWDEGSVYQKDHAVEMLQAYEEYLAFAVDERRIAEVDAGLAAIAKENRSAIIWRRLLAAGTGRPETLGLMIRELAWAGPILRSLDTTSNAGEFIRVMFPLLSPNERERVERAIVNVAVEELDNRRWAKDRRDRLLGCLRPELVTTPEARERLEEMQVAGDVPPNEPPFRISAASFVDPSIEARLERAGADVESDSSQALLAFRRAVSELTISEELIIQGGDPLTDALARLTDLCDALRNAPAHEVDTAVEHDCWGSLAEAAVRFARLEISCATETGRIVRGILGDAAERPEPEHDPQNDAQFDEHPGWGSPISRVEAAEGLMLLARHADCMTQDLLTAIDRLSRDPEPAVRFQIASRLWLLNKTARERMWELVERVAAEERSSGVLRWLVNESLGRLAQLDVPRVIGLVRGILLRFDSGPGVAELRERCLDILTGWYVWRDSPDGREELMRLAAIRPIPIADAGNICADLRKAFVAEKGPIDPQGDGVRARAIRLAEAFVTPALAELRELLERGAVDRNGVWSDADRDRLLDLGSFADLVGRELYFATGIFEERSQPGGKGERVTRAQRERLMREGQTLIESLADVGLPSVAHHLLEMLEESITTDPRRSFLLIGRVLVASKNRYEYEALAEGLFVRLIQRYLAEHRSLFQKDDECRTLLLRVLDIFVQAGWPSAQRLSYGLDEIFR